MKSLFKTSVLGVILLFFPALFFGLAAEEDPLLPGIEFFLRGSSDRAAEFLDNLEARSGDFQVTFGMAERELLRGRIRLWQGRIALHDGMEEKAEGFLRAAVALGAEAAEGLDSSGGEGRFHAEALRLQADALGEIMLFKGVPYIIRNGPKVQEFAEMAIAVDGQNADALVLYAQGRINAPRIFGGNRKEGLEILEALWLRRPGNEEPAGDRGESLTEPQVFRTALALAVAYEEKAPAQAERFYREAETLYPGNPYTRDR